MFEIKTELKCKALELTLKSFVGDHEINTNTDIILERAKKFYDFILVSQEKTPHKDIDEKE